MNKRKLKIARSKIDQLDNRIFNLIRKRTKVVKYMLSLKQFKNQIVDQKRINAILKKYKKKISSTWCRFKNHLPYMESNDLDLY